MYQLVEFYDYKLILEENVYNIQEKDIFGKLKRDQERYVTVETRIR